jgi:electron transport complex protein RnfB
MITIKHGDCIMCATCTMVCPVKALVAGPLSIEHYPEKCTGCAMCVNACPVKAITLHKTPADR